MKFVDLVKAVSLRFRRVGGMGRWSPLKLLVAAFAILVMGIEPSHAGNTPKWEQVLAAAKKEGKVVVAGDAGASLRSVMKDFQHSFPEIQLEFSGVTGRDFAPRLLSEQRVGQFLWDLRFGGAGTNISVLKARGALQELRPVFILPEVKEDKYWYGGFDFGFIDKEKKYVYTFIADIQSPTRVNRANIPASQLSSPTQIIEPRFKGKIVMADPRRQGAGSGHVTGLMVAYGEDFVRKLLTEQAVVFTRNARQVAEWVVRGRYPIGIGVRDSLVKSFRAQGVGMEVESLVPEIGALTAGSGSVVLIKNAPHPNAARVFINWLLSKRAQQAWVKASGANSRRKDLPPGNPAFFPKPERLSEYILQGEDWMGRRLKVIRFARGLIK